MEERLAILSPRFFLSEKKRKMIFLKSPLEVVLSGFSPSLFSAISHSLIPLSLRT